MPRPIVETNRKMITNAKEDRTKVVFQTFKLSTSIPNSVKMTDSVVNANDLIAFLSVTLDE